MRVVGRPLLLGVGLLFLASLVGCSSSTTRPLPSLTPYRFVTAWGDSGSGSGQFLYPWGVAVGEGGRIIVSDYAGDRVEAFTPAGAFLSEWGDSGSANGQFDWPQHVATDLSYAVYVADVDNHRVQRFAADGTYLNQWGTNGSGDGQFERLGGIAERGGPVYVADVVHLTDGAFHRVQEFTRDGLFLASWGDTCRRIAPGNSTHHPWDIAIDDSGSVYVTDTDNLRIRKFSGNGTLLTQWGTYGDGPGQFGSPEGIALDADANVYVTDLYRNRIQKFTRMGGLLALWGSTGRGNGQFLAPRGVAVDRDGNVYVVDSRRVQKFAPRR